ncbi:MAG: DUF2231 domain-containing protein [Bacteroidota bacterium]
MILLDTFVGRFHPLVVHLPIGFLILGILTEWFYRSEKARPFVAFAWLMGGISAFLAAFFGWLLAEEGGYEESSLFWHRWLGIALTLLSFAVYFVKSGRIKVGKIGHQVINVGVIALLSLVGHLGGNMTHGSDYLIENAPSALKAILGEQETIEEQKTIDKSADSTQIYADLVEPIFKEKCMQCHNDEVQRGALNMASPAKMAAGGDHGAVFVSGNAAASELFRRVTLLPNHAKYMPLKGQPMTFQEIKLLEWWLEEGASFEARLTEKEIPKGIQRILLENYGLDVSEKPYYEKLKIAPASEQTIAEIEAAGFEVKPLVSGSSLLEISFKGNKPDVEKLLKAREQITWLDLGNTKLQDEQLAFIGKLNNLTRLRLENNLISDKGVIFLGDLEHLESLNLHHTQVTNEVINILNKMNELKRVYLWETQVTANAVDQLRVEKSDLKVELGLKFASASG